MIVKVNKRTRVLSIILAAIVTSSILAVPTGNGMTAYAAEGPYVVTAGEEKLAVVQSEIEAENVIKSIKKEYTEELDKVKTVKVEPALEVEQASPWLIGETTKADDAVKDIMEKNKEAQVFTITAEGTATESKKINYKTKVENKKSIAKGRTKTARKGKTGVSKHVASMTIVNGEVVESKEIDKDVVKQPVSKIVHKGTFDGKQLVGTAKKYIGRPYVYGGNSLTRGTDCSGFVKLIYKKYGKSLPRSSSAMRSVGKKVSYKNAKPGDLITYSGHVAIYAGNDKIVHAANPRKDICVGPAKYTKILSVRRVVS